MKLTDPQKEILRKIEHEGLTDLRSYLSYNWRWGKGDWADGDDVTPAEHKIIMGFFRDEVRRLTPPRGWAGYALPVEMTVETSDVLEKHSVERDDYTEEFTGLEYRVALKPGVLDLLS